MHIRALSHVHAFVLHSRFSFIEEQNIAVCHRSIGNLRPCLYAHARARVHVVECACVFAQLILCDRAPNSCRLAQLL